MIADPYGYFSPSWDDEDRQEEAEELEARLASLRTNQAPADEPEPAAAANTAPDLSAAIANAQSQEEVMDLINAHNRGVVLAEKAQEVLSAQEQAQAAFADRGIADYNTALASAQSEEDVIAACRAFGVPLATDYT